MDLATFFRLARTFKPYTPTLTASSGTLSNIDIQQADYTKIGEIIVVLISVTYDLSVSNAVSLKMTLPHKLREISGRTGTTFMPVPFGGIIGQGEAAYCRSHDQDSIDVLPCNAASNITIGLRRLLIGGFFYQQEIT